MSHISIAIVRRSKQTNDHESRIYEYLVRRNDGGSYGFISRKSRSIGGNFNFSEFRGFIVDTLNLPRTYLDASGVEHEVDFENIDRFKSNREKPFASAYLYELSPHQVDHVDDQLKSKDGLWSELSWMSQEDLMKNADEWLEEQRFIFKTPDPFTPPTFSARLRVCLKNLANARRSGRLVVFVGAGVSIDSGVPGWGQLIHGLKADVDGIQGEKNPLKIAGAYKDQYGKKEYYDRVKGLLKYGKTSANPIHEKVFELAPAHVVTTNYDSHLEEVVVKHDHRYSIVRRDLDLPDTRGSSLVIKMHGDLGVKNIVLTKKDYKRYERNFPLIKGYVSGLFASSLVLFIGFSMTDKNLKLILRQLKKVLRSDQQVPYLLTTSMDSDKEIREFQRALRKEKVQVSVWRQLKVD